MISKYIGRFLRRTTLPKTGRLFSDIYVNHRETAENNDSTPFEFTDENYVEVENLLSKFPSNYKKSAVISLLFLAQKQNENFLTLAAMRKVADIVECSYMEVYEVAAFYTMFNRERLGKYHIQFCGTTPCMLCGIRDVMKAAEEHLGCKVGETTDDGMFTLVEVECLGACSNAPMLQVNNEYVYEDLDTKNVITLLDTLRAGKKPKRGPQIDRNHCEGPEGRTTLIDYDQHRLISRDFSQAKKEWEESQ